MEYRFRNQREAILRQFNYTCHLCGHGAAENAPARQLDHVVPVTEAPEREWDTSNMRPSHGSPGNPCPVCSEIAGKPWYCNQQRGSGSIQRYNRIAGELGLEHGRVAPAKPVDNGRAW